LFAKDAVLNSAMPSAAKSVAGWGRALGRDRLDLMLAEAATRAGAEIWQPWKMIGLERSADGFSCVIAADDRQQELHARIVIAANGSWERSPWLPAVPRSREPSELLAFKAHFRGSALAPDLMPLLVFPGGYGGMVHSDGGRVSLSCCIRRDALDACRQEHRHLPAGEAVLQHIVNTSDGVRDALRPAHLDGAWRPRYENGMFFVGNSAGEAHPIIAEGISMAMQSAWLLCQRLIGGPDPVTQAGVAEAGRLYAKDWHKAFATRIRAAAMFAHLAMWPGAAQVLPIVKRFPEILTWGARLSGKTTQLVQ
jgi:flavin-dependent dehydrogenase